MVEAYGGSVGDAGAVFLLDVCKIRLPTWNTLPTDWPPEPRSQTVADFVSTVRFYSSAVIIYDTADWVVGVASRELSVDVRRRLLGMEQLLVEGGWIRKPPHDLALKTIFALPKMRVLSSSSTQRLFSKFDRWMEKPPIRRWSGCHSA
jgi:hypothetical protein